ncbi:MAG TPA: transporter substrate-binding domain-containing protein [Rhodopila sp.]|uniref:transporter substrate-binding domain-containing protein n=1 Tax=Rhodopila sp. TaxID=2480087 RepID=UPI002C34C65E|nr:transporter substrate-binding domain-containing protein [Rhodopila sp.]HVY14401.1 transporter substrate-binding domain-containing protein [Rhodopila sp.]
MLKRLVVLGAICVLLLAPVLLTPLAARAETAPTCQPDKVTTLYPSLAGKTIRVGQDGVSLPFSYHDPENPDKIVGLDTDYARAVFACIGVPVTFDIGAWSGLLPAVTAGRIDAMWDDLYYTSERAQRVDYIMYMKASDTTVVQKGNPKKIHSMEDLCGTRALAGLGTVEILMLNNLTKKCVEDGKPAIQISTYQDRSTAWPMVETDRADAMLSSSAMAKAAIAARHNLAPGFDFLPDIKVGVAIAKNRPELAKAIANAMAALQASGEVKKLFVKYEFDPKLILPPEILTK